MRCLTPAGKVSRWSRESSPVLATKEWAHRSPYLVPVFFPWEGSLPERQERYDAKLVKILQNACQVFAEKGYHHASVRDVALATEVSPAGLYYYFSSKEELLFLILDHCFSSLLTQVEEALRGIPDPSGQIGALVRAHLTFFDEHRDEMRVLARDREALTGSYAQGVSRRQTEYSKFVNEALEKLSPNRPKQEIEAAGMALFGMLGWVYQWHVAERDLPVEDLAGLFTRIFLRGFPSQGGEILFGSEGANEGPPAIRAKRRRSDASVLSGPGF